MEELKTKYPELDKLLAKVWGAGADALHELREEIKKHLEDLDDDDLHEAFQEIENTLDAVEYLDTHRNKIKEVLGIKDE